nr:hypothetical protein [Lactococcus garvieae]
MALEHCQELMEKVETIEDKLHQLEVIKIEFRQEITIFPLYMVRVNWIVPL